jgi:UDP-N-acetylmuramoyl-L-alanyl-D-glutamate--2,6-diaminopimelate ligase
MKLTAKPPNKPGDELQAPPPRRMLIDRGMKLQEVAAGSGLAESLANPEAEISSVVYDSRQAAAGSLFVAIRGEKFDGNQFVPGAIERGARAIVSEMPRPAAVPAEVSWVRVADARKALATMAANFFGRPATKLQLVGVTGTNGKTTTTHVIDAILRAAGRSSGLFGTIVHRTPLASHAALTTTPESLDLQSFLAEVVRGGGTHAVLEASSHALFLDRLWGCRFAVAIFTNLTQDHLDFHKDLESYFAAKRLLFAGTGAGAPAAGVVNIDDPYGKSLTGLAARTITYGLESGAQVTTKRFMAQMTGLEFIADTPEGKIEVRSRLVGRVNVYNLLAAIGAAQAMGFARESIEGGIASLAAVPGRFERVDMGQPFVVVVDYAHTDDALRNLTATARELGGAKRLITLFGCGGERDRAKRPLMGEAAGRASDVVVLSSDNPRGEDPLLIINDALVGLQRTTAKTLVEPDRARAIELAIDEARPGDVVLLAGKGHETTQVLKEGVIAFDDREVARRALQRRGYGD